MAGRRGATRENRGEVATLGSSYYFFISIISEFKKRK
jgi:hypothetical protein